MARAVFVMLQSLIAQGSAKSDPAYSQGCLAAGVRAWNTLEPPGRTLDLAFWVVAGCELYRATKDAGHRTKVMELGRGLLRRQNTSFIANQRTIRGFWMEDGKPYVQQDPIRRTVDSSLPALAMIELYEPLLMQMTDPTGRTLFNCSWMTTSCPCRSETHIE